MATTKRVIENILANPKAVAAYQNGEPIQINTGDGRGWRDLVNPSFSSGSGAIPSQRYRPKPSEEELFLEKHGWDKKPEKVRQTILDNFDVFKRWIESGKKLRVQISTEKGPLWTTLDSLSWDAPHAYKYRIKPSREELFLEKHGWDKKPEEVRQTILSNFDVFKRWIESGKKLAVAYRNTEGFGRLFSHPDEPAWSGGRHGTYSILSEEELFLAKHGWGDRPEKVRQTILRNFDVFKRWIESGKALEVQVMHKHDTRWYTISGPSLGTPSSPSWDAPHTSVYRIKPSREQEATDKWMSENFPGVVEAHLAGKTIQYSQGDDLVWYDMRSRKEGDSFQYCKDYKFRIKPDRRQLEIEANVRELERRHPGVHAAHKAGKIVQFRHPGQTVWKDAGSWFDGYMYWLDERLKPIKWRLGPIEWRVKPNLYRVTVSEVDETSIHDLTTGAIDDRKFAMKSAKVTEITQEEVDDLIQSLVKAIEDGDARAC